MPSRMTLPIDEHVPQIVAHLEAGQNCVIQASPGSGKTTRVPPALLDAAFLKNQDILVLEPRRLAAKMAALRVADELGESAGETVGYQFRFENVSGPKTRLKFLTEGLLLRRLISDPNLTDVGCVILDEFHERHLHADVAIAHLKLLQKTKRPELRLVVMSATLDAAGVSRFLNDCPIVTVAARTFPVTTSHLPRDDGRRLDALVTEAVGRSLNSGDMLVFLPGRADIERCSDALKSRFGDQLLILPLYGELPKEKQMLVFHPAAKPKIILATNVAETSLTIDGITTVIDSGLHRRASYSWWSGVPSLTTKPISRASAIQRAGRAGRTAPGTCLRLYAQADFAGRAAFETPEIRRADLAQTVLEIKTLGDTDIDSFPWFDAPDERSLSASCELLANLGATANTSLNAPLTEVGKRLATLPLHPRLARVLIEAKNLGCLPQAATLCALISEGALESLDALDDMERKFLPENVKKVRQQLLDSLTKKSEPPFVKNTSLREGLAKSLLCGFPDRVARKRPADNAAKGARKTEEELVFCFGGSGTVTASGDVADHEYFVVLDVLERKSLSQTKAKTHVRSLCAIKPEWLLDGDTTLLKEDEILEWDAKRARVSAKSRILYGQIVIDEAEGAPHDASAAARVAMKALFGILPEQFATLSVTEFLNAYGKSFDAQSLETLLCRIALMRDKTGNTQIPDVGGNFATVLNGLSSGLVNKSDWEPESFCAMILTAIPYEAQRKLDADLPLWITLPGGRKTRVNYAWGQTPWIASRLQDFLGMRETPKLCHGNLVPVLHLLAPNGRAVQVTSDLASFWKNTYPEIRNQLARRYPRHKWPESGY